MENPRRKIVEVATRYIGAREHGKNQGPEIAEFWTYTSYPDGMENHEPYCMAGVDAWVQIADKESDEINLRIPPRMAAVRDLIPWAQRADVGAIVFEHDSEKFQPEAGDLIKFNKFSHVGVVESYDPETGIVHTIEANTDGSGSREGDGVYRRERRKSQGTYIRIAAVAVAAEDKAKQRAEFKLSPAVDVDLRAGETGVSVDSKEQGDQVAAESSVTVTIAGEPQYGGDQATVPPAEATGISPEEHAEEAEKEAMGITPEVVAKVENQ